METPSAMATTHDKKKRKKQHKRNKKLGDEEALTLEKLKTLGDQLLSSRAHINNLPILLSALSPSSPLELSLEALIPLQSFFLPLVDVIPSKSTIEASEEKDPELVYKVWLRARFDEFVNSLIEIAVDSKSDDALKDVALEAIMDFVKMGKEGKFQTVIYHRLLYNLVHATCSVDSLVDLLVQKYFNYIDVCYFTYTSLDKIAKNCDPGHMKDSKQADLNSDGQLSKSRIETAARIIYKILSQVPPLDSLDNKASYEMWSPSGLTSKEAGKESANVLDKDPEPEKSKGMKNEVSSIGRILKRIKLKFTHAWITFLRLHLPLDVYKEVLVSLRQNVIPYMANPAILCDFLTKSYDIGGVISVMALSGLFVLMTQHGLEYPKFYEKLYALLTPAAFMAKHRAVFFQLLDTCLKSSHLPAYLAAAFTKKLSRLALSVPPSGELVIIALIHNLLRRHPSINFLVHKPLEEDDGDAPAEANDSGVDATPPGSLTLHSKKHGVDPFKCDENEPSKSDAMRSSLWEIDSLRHHYCPAISRFVASLENDLTVRNRTSEVTIADFSSGSYATIFKDEMRRRVKQVPLAFYKVTPNTLFCESDFPGWSFGKEESAVKTVEDDGAEPAKRQRINNS